MSTLFQPRIMLLLCAILFGTAIANAEDFIDPQPTDGEIASHFGDVSIYYNVLPTSFLSADVASAYGLTRGQNKYLINLSVRQRNDDGDRALRATISGTSSDLIHSYPLNFREVIEQNAVYYIASFDISGDERRVFRLQVQTEARSLPYDVDFNKMLYVDKQR